MIKFQNKIKFRAEDHSYTSEDGRKLMSVSTLVHRFVEEFDPDGGILKKCAAKKGISPEELKEEWERINKESCDRGTAIHSALENFIKTKKLKKGPFQKIIKQFKKIKFSGELQTEQILYSLDYGIAGTCDLIEILDDGFLNLYDFKSNKRFSNYNFFGKRLLPPFSHFFETQFNIYSLQLSLYSFLLEESGYWVKGQTIFWINPKTELIETFEIPFLRWEVEQMLKHAAEIWEKQLEID